MSQGNHDLTLDSNFYAEYGPQFHNQNPQSSANCLELLNNSPSITYLSHSSATVRLKSSSGPRTQFKVFGSPYSPRHGLWAFYYEAPQHPSSSSELTSIWEQIPLDSDIVVTHTPPRTQCDETDERRATGCEALRQALWRVRPQLAVCGHIHDGRGSQRVAWDLTCANTAYREETATRWQDPGDGNNKLSLVDLTGRKAPSLANDGSHPGRFGTTAESNDIMANSDPSTSIANRGYTFSSGVLDARVAHGTLGLGGDTTSSRCDQVALVGRMGRRETCVVNAAIMKSRYPHTGGKRFNKPIVVDLNLPVWEE